MTPNELVAELQRRMDRAPDAVLQGEAAAVSTIVQTKVVGHQISGKGKKFRFQSNRGPAVAIRTIKKAREAAARAMREALND